MRNARLDGESQQSSDAFQPQILLARAEGILGASIVFHDVEWALDDGASSQPATADFRAFSSTTDLARLWRERFDVDSELLAKNLLARMVSELQHQGAISLRAQVRSSLNAIQMLMQFICKDVLEKPVHSYMINRNNLSDLQYFFLTNDESNGQASLVTRPISFTTYYKKFTLLRWAKYLDLSGFTNVIDPTISQREEEASLKRAYTAIRGERLTFADWKAGGSFNRLTLDYGRHYVEHCVEMLNAYSSTAVAIDKVIDDRHSLGRDLGLSEQRARGRVWRAVCEQVLFGLQPRRTMLAEVGNIDLAKLRVALREAFKFRATPLFVAERLESESSLSVIAVNLGLTPDQTNFDALMLFVNAWSYDRFPEVETCFGRRFPSIDLAKFFSVLEAEHTRLLDQIEIELPTRKYWKSSGLNAGRPGSKMLIPMTKLRGLLLGAAAVSVSAFTGWRASEFGFGICDIVISENPDILDQQAFPMRFQVNGPVPKTHGKTVRVHREITYATYRLLRQVKDLRGIDDDTPLFGSATSGCTGKSSMGTFLGRMWPHFVTYYKPFAGIDIASASEASIAEIKRAFGASAYSARIRARAEFSRVSFFLKYDSRVPDKRNGGVHFLWRYRNGDLARKETELIDTYLSGASKEIICGLVSPDRITPSMTRQISRELLDGCLYPSPHAFRHMWAEAVYRRFDGDVGWMIRSNFKHISKAMWLDYLRSKDHAALDADVKLTAKSSLVSRILGDSGIGFAGQFATRVRRYFRNTFTVEPRELDDVIGQFCRKEIEDLKATPWGYCMLMRRNDHSAKCAENGEPKRHKAAPSLCFACPNFLTQESSVDYIIFHLAKDLAILANTKVPDSYRRSSFNVVKSARTLLRKLSPENAILETIDTAVVAFNSENAVGSNK